MTGKGIEGFIALKDLEPYVDLLSNPKTFSVTQRVTSSPHRQEFTRNMATPCGGICTGPMLPVLSVSVCAHRSRTR
jgi:hypothetical protein